MRRSWLAPPSTRLILAADGLLRVELERITGHGAAGVDDLTARVASVTLGVEGVLVDAIETAVGSLEFRTDLLTNQRQPILQGNAFAAICERYRIRVVTADDAEEDATVYLHRNGQRGSELDIYKVGGDGVGNVLVYRDRPSTAAVFQFKDPSMHPTTPNTEEIVHPGVVGKKTSQDKTDVYANPGTAVVAQLRQSGVKTTITVLRVGLIVRDKNRTANRYEVPNDYKDRPYFVIGGWCAQIDRAHIQISCGLEGPVEKLKWRMKDHSKDTATPADGEFGDGGQVDTELTITQARDKNDSQDLTLLVGVDANKNGTLDDDEAIIPPIPVYVVTKQEYDYSLSWCDEKENAWVFGYWVAASLLEQFIGQETTPDYSDDTTTYNSNFALTGLDMPGLGIDCIDDDTGKLPIFRFADGSYTSNAVEEGKTLLRFIKKLISARKATIVDYFKQHAAETSATFTYSNLSESRLFTEEDLGMAYGTARITLSTMRVHATRQADTITIGAVDVVGEVWDIYDWRFWVHRHPAVVQVCYEPQCGRTAAGKVFGHRTVLSRDGIDPGVTITIEEP